MVRRIQRGRERGSRQPANTKYCGRPTEWGNPFPIGEEYTRARAMEAFREAFWGHELPVTPARARTELAAYDYLSCWCRLERPCHLDEYIRAMSCEHKLREASERSCLVCKVCLHRDIAIEGLRAACSDGELSRYTAPFTYQNYSRASGAFSPWCTCRHLRRLPVPVRLHRLQRSVHPGHLDSQAHTPVSLHN